MFQNYPFEIRALSPREQWTKSDAFDAFTDNKVACMMNDYCVSISITW